MIKRKLLFGLAGSLFLLAGGVYCGGQFAYADGEQQGVFSIPGFDSAPSPLPSAGETYQEVIRTDENILAQADRHYQSKRFFEAEKLYSEYVRQNAQVSLSSELALAYHRLGLIAKKRQLYDKAQEYLVSAIKTDPNKDPRITLDYAVILYDLGEYERAKSLLLFLNEHSPNMEEAKIYLGKTLLEVEPSIELLPLLETEYGRIDACEILSARCREVGNVGDAEKLEKILYDEKVKGDQVFFAAPTPFSEQTLPQNNVSFEPSSRIAEGTAGPNSAVPSEVKEGFASSAPAVHEAIGDLAGGNDSQSARGPYADNVSDSADWGLGGYPGLVMDDGAESAGIGLSVSQESISPDRRDSQSFSEMDEMANRVANQVRNQEPEQMAEDFLRDRLPSFAEAVPENARSQSLAEDYSGFDGYLPPAGSVSKRVGITVPRASAIADTGSAPVPDFSFVSRVCAEEPERVAFLSDEPSAPAAPPQDVPRRLTSEEKLEMAERAGAKITYLTPDQYNNEIATRAGKVVKHAEEEISKSNLDESQKNDLLQKIFGK